MMRLVRICMAVVWPMFYLISSCSTPSGAEHRTERINKIAFNQILQALGEEYALALVNPDGSNLNVIGPGKSNSHYDFFWSEDGAMISFVDEYTRSLNSDSSYGYQINVVSVADLKLTTLEVYGNDPIISPDNKMIAFEIYVQYPSIRVMNLDGSNINILVTNFQNLQGWTADSKKVIFTINDIYYAKDISGNNDPVEIDNPDLPVKVIYLSDYTRDPRSIVTADSLVMNSGLSPDRSKGFVVWRIRTTLPGLPFPILSKFGLMFLYDFNSLQETLLADEVQSLLDVSWSPDGRQIAFVDSSGINVINANGSYRKEIVPFIDGSQDFNQLSLRWSPK